MILIRFVVCSEPRSIVRLEVVIMHEIQAVWALIVVTAVLVGAELKKIDWIKHWSSFGPLPGVVISLIVIVLLPSPPNSGNGKQEGFSTIMTQACISAGLHAAAAGCGFYYKEKIGVKCYYNTATMGLVFGAGLMTSISGLSISAANLGPDKGLAGVILGAIVTFLMLSAWSFYMFRVCRRTPPATPAGDKKEPEPSTVPV